MARIQDYAVIGNSRSAALISGEGSLDWLCWPRFDSPSLFAALLDKAGGFWKIAPLHPARIERKYLEETNILQTTFFTQEGTLVLTDFIPILSEEDKHKSLYTENEIIRHIVCISGSVEIEIIYNPQPKYALSKSKLKDKGKLGLRIEYKGLFTLHSPCSFKIEKNRAHCVMRLHAQESTYFSLTYHSQHPAILTSLDAQSILEKMQKSAAWWRNWVQNIEYEGAYKKQVIRSALVLKLLNYAPSGTFVASLTTSLPEHIGGNLNWDYRFSWLRDASFITQALYGLNLHEEAYSFVNWLLYSTKLSLSQTGVFFDIYGRDCGREKILRHFKGYKNSSPVRIGNAASRQFQLDIHGEVAEAVSLLIKNREYSDLQPVIRVLLKFGKYVCQNWQALDNGVWEYRGEKNTHTYSLLMCWLTLEKILQVDELLKLKSKLKTLFKQTQQSIREVIESKCWNSQINSYTDILGGKEVGVSLLQLAIRGFEFPNTSKMLGTYARIQNNLLATPALYFRNETAIKRGEGAFHLCNFWNVQYLAGGGGTLTQAKTAFAQALLCCNDVGLLSEEIDPETKEALGNFPQGLSHAGLINAALSIQKREKKEK